MIEKALTGRFWKIRQMFNQFACFLNAFFCDPHHNLSIGGDLLPILGPRYAVFPVSWNVVAPSWFTASGSAAVIMRQQKEE